MGEHLTGGNDIETKVVLKKLISSISANHKGSIGDDALLIETGILDSLGILKLVSAIEEQFGIEVLDEELIPENFHTVNDIARLIESKQKVA